MNPHLNGNTHCTWPGCRCRFEEDPKPAAAFIVPLIFVCLLMAAFASLARGQTTNGKTERMQIGSVEVEKQPIAFENCTINLTPTPVITITKVGGGADANPSAMLSSVEVTSTQIAPIFDPNASCTPTACRRGRIYQVNVQPSCTDGTRPIGTFRVDVQDTVVDPNK